MVKYLIVLLMVAVATQIMAESANSKLSKEEVKDIIVSLDPDMKDEVVDAVKTINEVFEYPGCAEKEVTKRGHDFKRHALAAVKRDCGCHGWWSHCDCTARKREKNEEEAQGEKPGDGEAQFQIDVARLKEAVRVLNEVVTIADVTLKNEQ